MAFTMKSHLQKRSSVESSERGVCDEGDKTSKHCLRKCKNLKRLKKIIIKAPNFVWKKLPFQSTNQHLKTNIFGEVGVFLFKHII